jgi:hypothetical protein
MTARGKMTMRAVHQQDQQAGTDGYNRTDPPSWVTLNAALPCWVYSKRTHRVIDGTKSVTVEDLRAMVPLGTTISGGERFLSVSSQAGGTIHSTPLKIRGVQRRVGHLELVFEDSSQ